MHAPLNYLLTAFGSTGDLVPLLSMGQSLKERGHRVKVLTSGGHVDLVEGCGLECVPLSPAETYERSLRDVFLLGTRYHGLFFKRYAVEWNVALLKAVAGASRRDTVLVSAERPLMWADLCAHLHFGLTSVRIVVDPPPLFGASQSSGVTSAKTYSTLSEEWQGEWRRAVAPLRVHAGHLHAARLTRASNRSVPRLAVWPKWLAPDAARVPNLQTFGFVGSPTHAPTQRVESSDRKRPLLVFCAGSVGTTRTWEQRFADVSQGICESTHCDGLLLGGSQPTIRPSSTSFTWRKFTPLEAVLPSASAIVHHGGVGTAAAALQHGVPQLIVPRMFSQPSTAEWVRRLGAAVVLPPADYSLDAGSRLVRSLIANSAFRNASRSCGASIDPAVDRTRICDFVEDWHRRRTHQASEPSERALYAAA